MTPPSQESILSVIVNILGEMNDWEYSGEITRQTWFAADLGFQSIDAAALGAAIEEHYRRPFPFVEFIAAIGQRGARDMTLGELVDFIDRYLNGSAAAKDSGQTE